MQDTYKAASLFLFFKPCNYFEQFPVLRQYSDTAEIVKTLKRASKMKTQAKSGAFLVFIHLNGLV